VCKAKDPMLERPVAVKVLEPREGVSESYGEAFTRFRREGQAVGRLQHENIIVLHDAQIGAGSSGDSHYLVFDCAEGGSLATCIKTWRIHAQLDPPSEGSDAETVSLLGDSGVALPHRPAPQSAPGAAAGAEDTVEQHAGAEPGIFTVFEQQHPGRFDTVARWVREVAAGLQHSHRHGVCHRDIKPANILLTASGDRQVAKVGDFGMAWVAAPENDRAPDADTASDENSALPASIAFMTAFTGNRELTMGRVLGTPIYMDPHILQRCRDALAAQLSGDEQAEDNQADTEFGFGEFAQCDQYALGLVMYQLLTLTHPYDDRANQEPAEPEQPSYGRANVRTMNELLAVAPRPVQTLNPHVPTALALICEKAISRDPRARYKNMEALANDLDSYLRGGDYAGIQLPLKQRFVRWCRRNTAALVVMLLLTALVGLASGGSYLIYLEQQRSVQAEAATRLSKHKAAVNAAREASARGDWKAAEAVYATAIADGYDDAPELEVEQVSAYFALDHRDEVGPRLEALAARKDLPEHSMALITMLRGELLLADQLKQKQGFALVRQALDTGLLSEANQALARGLLAKSADAAFKEFELAIEIEPFHHRAHHTIAIAYLVSGRLEDARRQAAFMQKVFPEDIRPICIEAFTRVLNGDTPGALALLEPLKKKIEPQRAETLINAIRLIAELLENTENDPATALLKLAQRPEIRDDAGPLLKELGVSTASWSFASFQELAVSIFTFARYLQAKQNGVRRAPLILDEVIAQLDNATKRNPDASFLYFKASYQLLRLMEHMARNEKEGQLKMAVALHKTACKASRSPSLWPAVRYQAAILALGSGGVARIIEAQSPSEAEAMRARTRALVPALIAGGRKHQDVRAKQLQKITSQVLCDFDVCRIVLIDWKQEEPENPAVVYNLAKMENAAGEFRQARKYAGLAMELSKPSQPGYQEMQKLMAELDEKIAFSSGDESSDDNAEDNAEDSPPEP